MGDGFCIEISLGFDYDCGKEIFMEELMPSLNHNSKSDFITAIFNKYRHSMKRVASRILKDPQSAEDTVSEAMIKIIKNVDIIDDIESKKCAKMCIRDRLYGI